MARLAGPSARLVVNHPTGFGWGCQRPGGVLECAPAQLSPEYRFELVLASAPLKSVGVLESSHPAWLPGDYVEHQGRLFRVVRAERPVGKAAHAYQARLVLESEEDG
jgi:hypothetical protein